MAQISISKIQVRRGQEFQTGIPQLDPGEFGWAEDTENLYIGKRIVEGAVDDNNTRILTENDLSNIFSLIQPPGNLAGTSSYQYRADTQYVHSTTTTISTKLDNWVSLTDYDPSLSPSFHQSQGHDITLSLTAAIENLYFQGGSGGYGTVARQDARRRLIIPAGTYFVSSTIDLPPYTSLVGEGADLTNIVFLPSNDGQPLFRTVDAGGQNFDDNSMDMSIHDGQNAGNVHIEGMSLLFTSTNAYNAVLVSLDQITDVNIQDVEFSTANLVTSTNYGSALRVRSGIISDQLLDDAPAGNIKIQHCKFHNLGSAITQSTGTINRFFVTNCTFNYLQTGISMWSNDPANPGLIGGVFETSRFERISNQAILLGTPTSNVYPHPGYSISMNNSFKDVGNGVGVDGNPISDNPPPTSVRTPVITFNSDGNKSINDIFVRQDYAQKAVLSRDPHFYYNPYISGPAGIQNDSVYRRELSAPTNDLIGFPLNGGEQSITIHYELWNSNTGYSRKGNLLINIIGIDPAGAYTQYQDGDQVGSITDNYNYSYINKVNDAVWSIDSSQAGSHNYVTLQILGFDIIDVDPNQNGPYRIDYQIKQIS